MMKPTGCPDFSVALPRERGGATIRAADFGFSPDNNRNQDAINAALAEAKRVGAARVELAPGTYRCYDGRFMETSLPETPGRDAPMARPQNHPGIVLSGFSDFTFDGCGAVLVFRRPPEFRCQPQSEVIPEKANILVRDCERCVVGNFTMDWDWAGDPPGAFVRVVAKHIDAEAPERSCVDLMFVDWERHPKFPEPVPVQKMAPMDECRTRLRPGAAFSFGQTEGHFGAKNEWVAPNVLRLWPGMAMENRNQNPATLFASDPAENLRRVEAMEEGGLYRLLHCYYGKNGINLVGNRHLTVRDVSVWSCFGMAMTVDGPQKFWQVERLRVAPPTEAEHAAAYPGEPFRPRPVSSTSDGHHVHRSQGMCRYVGCRWSLNNDDAFNIHDRFTLAVKCGEKALQIINRRGYGYFRAEAGALLELRNADYSATGFTARLAGLTGEYGGREVLLLDKPVPEQRGPCFLVWDRTYGSNGLHLRNCVFEDSGFRNLVSSSDVTVEGCVFRRTGGAPLRFIADYRQSHWCEGTGSRNLVVRDCLFEDCAVIDRAAPQISAVCVTPAGWDVGALPKGFVGGDALIENNRFVRPSGPLFDFACGDNVAIEGHSTPWQTPPCSPGTTI